MSSKMELIFQKKNIGLGKRKEAVARVFLIPGEGNIIINNVPGDKYSCYSLFSFSKPDVFLFKN